MADRLSVSKSMAWKLVTNGQLRSVRIGRSVRVRPQDLDAFAAGLCIVPPLDGSGTSSRV